MCNRVCGRTAPKRLDGFLWICSVYLVGMRTGRKVYFIPLGDYGVPIQRMFYFSKFNSLFNGHFHLHTLSQTYIHIIKQSPPPRLSVCLLAMNSKTTARIFMRFSPIEWFIRIILVYGLSMFCVNWLEYNDKCWKWCKKIKPSGSFHRRRCVTPFEI